MSPVLAATLPDPAGVVADGLGTLVGRGVSGVGGSILSAVGEAVTRGLAGACGKVTDALLGFLSDASGPDFAHGWWVGPRGQHIWGVVAALAAVLLVGFALLAIVQGLLAGDPGAMVRSVLVEVPVSVAGMVVVVAATQALLGVVDAASAMVLDRVPADLGQFLGGFALPQTIATGGFAGGLLELVFLLGALLVWIELVVRASLLYLLVALAPLALAARVWPAARGVARKLCELGVALIASKFAISLALGLGAAAMAGGSTTAGSAALGLNGLLAGGALMLLAAFCPFILLRLVPVVEAAMVAQGVSRTPLRAAQGAMQATYYGQSLRWVAGGGRSGAAARAGGGGSSSGGDGQEDSPGGGGGSGPGGGGPRGGPGAPGPSGAGHHGGERRAPHRRPAPPVRHLPARPAAAGALPVGAGARTRGAGR